MGHTAEPWCVGNTRTVKYATGEITETSIHYGAEESRGNCIAITYGHFGFEGSEADARRIVACVNYCAGLDTEGMETSVAIGRPATAFVDECQEKMATLQLQRDNLLTEVERLKAALAAIGWSRHPSEKLSANKAMEYEAVAVKALNHHA